MGKSEAEKAAQAAALAWEKAPVHVKVMAGAYMRPVLHALDVLSKAVGEGSNGHHA